MKVLISTDSSAKVVKSFFEKNEVSVFPLNVIIDGQEFLDGVTIEQEELAAAMRSGKVIKTSTPPLGEVIEYFEKLLAKGYDHVIHFTISSKLSSMYDLFCNVAKQHFDGKVTIIDSYTVSSAMLNNVAFAYEEVQKGTSVDQIVAMIEERKKKMFILFVPENLNALKNGGRVSPAMALIGNTIGIKPVLLLSDGEIKKDGMTKRVRKTIEERLPALTKEFPIEQFDYSVVCFDVSEEKLKLTTDLVCSKIQSDKILTGYLPINVSAHCGPGTTGLVISPKVNGKSLAEFF